MPHVHIPSGLIDGTGGAEVVAIDAARVRDLMLELRSRFPQIGDQLERMAIAIDGRIYHQADYEALRPDSHVYFVPPIAGG